MTDILKWNAIANEYSDWLDNQKDKKGFAFNQSLTEAIVRRLPVNETLNLLDLGCGNGSLVNQLSYRYEKVVGFDGAENMITIAKMKYPHLSSIFSVNDITKPLPIGNDSFDIVLCNMVLMDLENIEDTLVEIYRVLKKGGVFVLTTNHPCFSFVSHHLSKPDKRYIDSFQYEKVLDNTFSSTCNNYHRPIQFYVRQLLQVNFIIKDLEEISANADEQKILKRYELTANALLIEAHK